MIKIKLQTKDIKFRYSQQLKNWVCYFNVPQVLADDLNKLVNKDCVKSIEIKEKRKSKTKNANSALWALMNEMAIKLKNTDVEVYHMMLRRYGTKEYYIAPQGAKPLLEKAYKIVEAVKDMTINDKDAEQFRCIRGSSTYDREEFSVLLDGTIQDAAELNVYLITQEERNSYINNWEGN